MRSEWSTAGMVRAMDCESWLCRFNSSARNIKGGGEEKKTIIVQIYLNTRSLSLYHRADRVAAFFVAFQTDLARRRGRLHVLFV